MRQDSRRRAAPPGALRASNVLNLGFTRDRRVLPLAYYVIVRGPLGAGKTTVSDRLARAIAGSRIAIDQILEEYDLERWDEDCISEASFLEANGIAARRAMTDLQRGVPVVIDGNFYWKSAVEDLVRRLPFPHLVLTLKAPLSVCVARDAMRAPPHGPDAAQEVYAKTTSFDYGILLDATGSVDHVVGTILEELRRAGLPGAEPRRKP